MKNVKKVIIGPTFYAAGQLLQADNDVLVTGRNSSIGDEWCYSYRNIASQDFFPQTDFSLQLKKQLDGLGLNSPGKNALAFSVLLYERLAENSEKLRLWTELESIKENADGFELTLYTVSGREVVQCEELLDNTVKAVTFPVWGAGNIKSKSLNMLVECNVESVSGLISFEGLKIYPGRVDSEKIVSYEIDPDASMQAVRAKMLDIWQNRPESARAWKIGAFGSEFDYETELDAYEIKPNWHYLNPLAFDNPASAFEAGLTGGVK